MKRAISNTQFRELPVKVQLFIFDRQRRNGLPRNPNLDIADCIELIKLLTRNYSNDNEYHAWKAHVLECGDVTLAWESDLVDDLFYELLGVRSGFCVIVA